MGEFSASLRNLGSRIGSIFEKKKKDVAEAVEETQEEVAKTVEEEADKIDENVKAAKDSTEKAIKTEGINIWLRCSILIFIYKNNIYGWLVNYTFLHI